MMSGKTKHSSRRVPTDPVAYAAAVALVRGRDARWRSAYASGQVVVEYRRAMLAKGRPPYEPTKARAEPSNLRRWFLEQWVDIRTGEPCSHARAERYPVCRPSVRVTAATPVTVGKLTPAERARVVARKTRAGPQTARYPETKEARARTSKKLASGLFLLRNVFGLAF